MLTNWKAKAMEAAALIANQEKIINQQQALIEKLVDQPRVAMIQPTGKKVRFHIVRGEKLFTYDFLRLMADDPEQWKKDLLGDG